MFPETRYLRWASRLYGQTRLDLASSGMQAARWSDLGSPAVDVDDAGALTRLRRSVAAYNDLPEAEVFPALGTSHAIFLAYAALLSPGDEILVETPGYEPLTRAAEGLGAVVRTFERAESKGFAVDPGQVAAAMGPRTRAVVVTNLHNPSGVRVPDATLRELATVAAARGSYLVVDEVYAPFDALPEDGIFRGSARKLAPNVIALGSLTKAYGLGLYRLGWVAGPFEVIARAENASIATMGHAGANHAAYGIAAFRAVGLLARRAMRTLEDKRLLAEHWAASHPAVRWSAPKAGLYGLVTVPGAGDLTDRIESHARATGVLVAAGSFFGAPESFRLSWATTTTERFAEGLAALTPLVVGAANPPTRAA